MPLNLNDLKRLWNMWMGKPLSPVILPPLPHPFVGVEQDSQAENVKKKLYEFFFNWNKRAVFVSDNDLSFNETFKEQVSALGKKFDLDKLQSLAREETNQSDAFFRVYYEGGLLKEISPADANKFFWNDGYAKNPLNDRNLTVAGSVFNGKDRDGVRATISRGGIKPKVFSDRARAIILFLGLKDKWGEWRRKTGGNDPVVFLKEKFDKVN